MTGIKKSTLYFFFPHCISFCFSIFDFLPFPSPSGSVSKADSPNFRRTCAGSVRLPPIKTKEPRFGQNTTPTKTNRHLSPRITAGGTVSRYAPARGFHGIDSAGDIPRRRPLPLSETESLCAARVPETVVLPETSFRLNFQIPTKRDTRASRPLRSCPLYLFPRLL